MQLYSNYSGQTFVENWIVIHLCRILKYFYFNISYKGKIDSLTPLYSSQQIMKPPRAEFNSRETKCQVKWHGKGMRIGKKIPRKYVTNGKEKFLACQFTLHLAANYFYFLEFTCHMAISCFTGLVLGPRLMSNSLISFKKIGPFFMIFTIGLYSLQVNPALKPHKISKYR